MGIIRVLAEGLGRMGLSTFEVVSEMVRVDFRKGDLTPGVFLEDASEPVLAAFASLASVALAAALLEAASLFEASSMSGLRVIKASSLLTEDLLCFFSALFCSILLILTTRFYLIYIRRK